MKRTYLMCTAVALLVFVSLACMPMRAQIAGLDLAEIMENIQNPETWYYVNMTARNSTTSGGSGQVKLMTITTDSTRIYDTFMGQDLTAQMKYALWPNGNPQGFASQVTQLGFSLIYMPGVEVSLGGLTISTYAYFAGWAKADDGSYFDGWSYADGGTELGMGGAESDWSGEEKLDEDNFVRLQILPDNNAGYNQDPATYIISGKTNRTVYATFRPVLVGEYSTTLGDVEATVDATGTCSVEIEVKGRDIDDDDFNDPVLANSTDWSVDSWYYDSDDDVVYVDLVYTAPAGVTIGQEYKTKMTFSSKGGSAVTIPVTVRAVAPEREEATLKIGDSEQSGDWTAMLAAALAASGEPVALTLNKDVTVSSTQVINKTLTLNLNGYQFSSSDATPLKINGGVVTLLYSKYGGTVVANDVAIEVAAGELVLEGGNVVGQTAVDVKAGGKLTANGATLDGTLSNAGTTLVKDGYLNGADYAIRNTGNLTILGGAIYATTGVYVESGTALLKKGRIEGGEVAVLSTGTTTIEKLAELVSDGGTALQVNGGTTTVNCGKFDADVAMTASAGTLNFVSGYFKSKSTIPAGKQVWDVPAGPEKAAGYIYFAGDKAAQQAAGVGVCTIGTTGYATLEDALAYANNNKDKEVVIVMKNDYTLPSGYFTLPAKAMLLIPFETTQETGYELLKRVSNSSVQRAEYSTPTEFRRLTLANGCHLDVYGKIEVSGRQFASDDAYAAVPFGNYGLIQMDEGSTITMQSGSLLRVWGYVTGKGEIDVRRGATVREQFQMGDWKGGTTSMGMLSDSRHVFPLTQYYIQSIEAPTKYHAGSVLSTATAVSAGYGGLSVTATANDIKIVGIQGQDDAMFLMEMAADEENTWVRKWYDVENDIQTYEVYSSAHIGSMVLDLGKMAGMDLQMHSGWFNLPITNNMKIHLLYGYMDFTQTTELLPGAEVEVDKESTVAIVNTDGVVSGSLYVYDADDWDTYAYDGSGNTKTKAVKYSPSWFAKNGTGKPTVRNLNQVADAKINVHGTFDTSDGYIFTSEHGANNFSSNEDAGTFTFTTAALAQGYTEDVYQVKGRSNYENKVFSPAQLKNGEGATPAYATTAGTAEGKSYCYINDRWTLMTVDEDNPSFVYDNYGDYYAKPNAYVAVNATKTAGEFSGNADHTYSGKYEQDRLFILQGNGQWWEVTVKDNLYYCADNDMYYEWSDTEDDWVEKKFSITWKNWDGTVLTYTDQDGTHDYYSVPYGTMAEYRSTNPEREADVDYTYDFVGWSPALGKVTTDVTYTAQFTKKQRKYTIVFQTEGGVEIERQFLTRDEFPTCENEPTKVGHILRWEPGLAAVTGDATYTATWLEEPPTTWTIRFVNYNGTELQSGDVVAGTMPTEPATPTKPATSEYTYTFTGWHPALEEASRDLTYTAQFNEVEKTYAITFTDENDNVLGTIQNLTYGEAPVVPAYSKAATAQYTYTIDWSPKVTAVSGNQTYKAVVTPTTNKYTVACTGIGCTFTGAGIYEYGSTPTLSVAAQANYTNAQWSDGASTSRTITVTGDVTLTATAQFVPEEGVQTYTITFLDENGNQLAQVEKEANSIPSYSYTKAATDQYTYLTAWSPTIQPVRGDMTYKADLTPVLRQYTITCEGEHCIVGGSGTYDYGTKVILTLTAAEGYENAKWSDETTGNKVITVTGNATYSASASLIQEPEPEPEDLVISATSVVDLHDATCEYASLTLKSNGTKSGDLRGISNLTVTGAVNFDLEMAMADHTWYAVAVPWEVNADNGIFTLSGLQLVLGTDVDFVYYDGATRAAQGKVDACWKYVELDGDHTLYPGRLYMAYLLNSQTGLRFEKKAGADLIFDGTVNVATYTGAALDANWNGIANPTTYHATLNAGVTYGQFYNGAGYTAIALAAKEMIVGQPVFVQAASAQSVVINAASAPGRMMVDESVEVALEITSENGLMADRAYAIVEEGKANEYVIGADLAKMSISTTSAQLWVNRYDAQLCVNTVAPVNDVAEFPLTISAPTAGDYMLTMASATGEVDVYLLYNGVSIWKLSDLPYTLTLSAGQTENYSIRVASRAPQTPTSAESIGCEGESARIILMNGTVYILRGGSLYTTAGQLVY